ncbi:hypothetical protein [Candidatus Nitrosotenuis aquarius]|uniref:hypothetical protein n=1 Tax=Candidatus Nitrosotenuis aquarius TaxID=1846278 RepID=UPI000C1DEE9D|nr:hypothetical protein [Candidatus Nitrosotenuis aquarius]
MKLQIALIMTGISIILLAIYGADAMWSIGKSHGFLPLDARTRGMALGFPSVILPVISYIITRNVASKTLGVMIAVAGVFMFGGSAAFLGMQDQTGDPNQLRSAISSLAVIFAGIIISVLGAIKIRKS